MSGRKKTGRAAPVSGAEMVCDQQMMQKYIALNRPTWRIGKRRGVKIARPWK
jgi:hypothetical protein